MKDFKIVGDEIVDIATGELISPVFSHYTGADIYERNGVIPIEPMTAQTEKNAERLKELLNSKDVLCEEKIDGTRGVLHIGKKHNRLFSRRISKKTGWYAENSDSVPHIRDVDGKAVADTIIDGELILAGDFKKTSSTLNCNYDEAIKRQMKYGAMKMRAFDIIRYKGVSVEKMPLIRRKHYLNKVIRALDTSYIVEVPFFSDTIEVSLSDDDRARINRHKDKYPNLYRQSQEEEVHLDKQAYYEYIVFIVKGEGVMLKPKDGIYEQRRTKHYIKMKKEISKDCFIVGYSPPTREYGGKNVKTWLYWEHKESKEIVDFEKYPEMQEEITEEWLKEYEPITKHYAKGWIGTIQYAVTLNELEKQCLTKDKDHTIIKDRYLVVCDTGGIDEELRQEISENKEDFIGRVVELKANEMFEDTGRLRHPTFSRFRPDKNWEECTLTSHLDS